MREDLCQSYLMIKHCIAALLAQDGENETSTRFSYAQPVIMRYYPEVSVGAWVSCSLQWCNLHQTSCCRSAAVPYCIGVHL